MTRAGIFLLVCAALYGAVGSAANGETPPAPAPSDSKAIAAAADRFMQGHSDELLARLGTDSRVSYTLTALDRRLAMPGCMAPLDVSARTQSRLSTRLNLQVSCASGNTWSIYVPVELAVFRPVVTANRPLAHGETLQAGDLRLSEVDIARLTGQYLIHLDEAVGMAVRRPIRQDAAVLGEYLEPPLLVERGDVVMIVAADGVVAVKMPGIAMTDGRRGEQIRIKNTISGKIVSARMKATGVAEVVM